MKIQNKLKLLFEKHGFVKVIINNEDLFHKNNYYYRITFVKSLNSFIIESAEGIEEVEKNLFEDSDVYPISLGEEELLKVIDKDLTDYYDVDPN